MDINFFAVLVTTIITNLLGLVWYGPKLFGKNWARVMGINYDTMTPEACKESRRKMASTYIWNFLLSFLIVTILAWALGGESNVGVAIKTAFVIWLGFSMPIQASSALWSGKPKSIAREMFLVSAGFQLIAFIVAGMILALWR